MRAGGLDHKVTIQTATETRDSFGAAIQTWADTSTVWAQKIHQGAREFFSAQKINAETTDVFKTRYLSGVTTKMRLVDSYDSKTYDIIGTWEGEKRKRELFLLCRQVE